MKTSLAIAAAVLLVSGTAQALTLTNRDGVEQLVQITSGGDEAVTQDLVIASGETLDELCEDGCVIALENGAQESFEGFESVIIEDGLLVLAE